MIRFEWNQHQKVIVLTMPKQAINQDEISKAIQVARK